MFEHLERYNVVLVTGPQRSGTTIAARMIAHDTGKTYVDETEFGVEDVRRWMELVERAANCVVQCPGMCRYVHRYGRRRDLAVVLLRRPVREIVASQERIGWAQEPLELARYGGRRGRIAAVKYAFWRERQWTRILNVFETPYHDLKSHALWIDPEGRRGFGSRQTTA